MKKILSIALALMMVLMPTVWAAPTMQTVESATEIAAEIDPAEEKAALSAGPKTLAPGLNMLTGTADLLNAEGDATVSDFSGVFSIDGQFDSSKYAIIDNPDKNSLNNTDKVFSFPLKDLTQNDPETYYPGFRLTFSPAIENRPIYTTFKIQKVNKGTYTSSSYAWLLSDDGGYGIVKSLSIAPNTGWLDVTGVYDYDNTQYEAANNGTVSWLKIHLTSRTENTTPTTVLIDELGFYPTYKITYMDATGENVLATDYALLDENGDFLTTYFVEPIYSGANSYATWSTSIGGNDVTSVPLANEDLVFYATSFEPAITSVTADRYDLDFIGDKVDITAALGEIMSDYSSDDITWTVEGNSVILDLYKGETVTATAIADGETTVTAKIEGATKSITLNVVEAFELTSDRSYVSGDEFAHITYEFKNGYADSETITWSIDDPDGVADLVENPDGSASVYTNAGEGEGVVKVTATLDSNSAKKKTVALYMSASYVDSDTKLVVTPETATISEDLGTVLVSANVFSTDANADLSVSYTNSDNTVARLFVNPDGTATVEAVKDGTTVVTVTSAYDPDITATATITVTGQREKYQSYDIRYLAFGNSFLDHGPYDGWPWEDPENGNRGMAASRVELDYFNRTVYHLTHSSEHGQNYYANVEAVKGGSASWETKLVNYTLENAKTQAVTDAASLINKIKSFKPNVLTVQLAENVRQYDYDILCEAYDGFYGAIAEAVPEDCIVVVITLFKTSTISNATVAMAEKHGFLVNDMRFVQDTYGGGASNKYLAFEQYADAPTVNAFGSHPGDWGMNEIAVRNVEQIEARLSSYITPEYIYLPTAFEISGDDAITTANGSAKYTISTTPSDAAKDAVWSVDNTNIATITQKGVLTAINNGSVVITAKSAYDDTVIATKTVTISGQTPCYTVSYAAGTDDTTVEGLPEPFIYAKDKFVLSTATPTRKGYKFVGWALKENGTPVTVATITANTTVYATWEFADSWYFETDGNYEGVERYGLFNETVSNGVYHGVSYESQDGFYIFNDSLIIDSKYYQTFRFEALMTTAGADTGYDVVITTTDGQYNFSAPVTTADMTEFEFDITGITGTITGFKIVPVVPEATIEIEEIEFVRLPGEDIVYVTEADTVLDAENGAHVYGTINISEGASVILKNGIFHVDDFTGNTNAITTVDANLFTEDDIPGYAVIDLGEKADEAYTRFVQIDGYTYSVRERENVLGLAFTEERVILVSTKSGDTLIDSKYYCIADGNANEIDVFGNSLITTPGASMRADLNTGIRYRASVTKDARANTDTYEIVEYGFIMARQDQLLKKNAQLNFDFDNVAYGAAYLKNDNKVVVKNNVFQMDDTNIFFTGVAVNIPVKAYTSVLSARPYMKIETANGVYTVYGEVISRSIYQVARSILADENNGLSDEEIEIVKSIINSVQPDNESFIDIGGLY